MTSTVQAIFCRIARPDSWFLRTVMWSSWSHCALIMPGGDTIIDATFFHGVAERSLPELKSRGVFAIKEIACPDPIAAYDFARSQLGKPYDTEAVIGIGLHRNWASPEAWFCSEFLEACLSAGGNQRFIQQIRRVTPQHSWMVK